MNNESYINQGCYHTDVLNSLMEADKALAFAPELAIDEAHLQSHVTLEWLQQELGSPVAGAQLEKIITADEHSGMTSRQQLGLQWNEAGREAGLPSMVFIKATPDEAEHRVMLSILHMHELEAKFYQSVQADVANISPKAHYAKSYPGGRFLILLEDLSLTDCKPYWLKDLVGIDHIRAVTVALAELHSKFWESERLQTDLSWVRPRTCRYGWPWLSEMTSVVRKAFPAVADEELLPKGIDTLLAQWDEQADAVFDYFETLPHTVLHGDCHVGNTFSYPDGRAGLFDWQVMFSGHGLRDFVYFVFSAITEEERKLHEKELFELYLSSLAKGGVVLNKEQAWNDYCLFVLDRWDAGVTTIVHGSYGHDEEAQRRGFLATNGSIIDNDIAGVLQRFVDNKDV